MSQDERRRKYHRTEKCAAISVAGQARSLRNLSLLAATSKAILYSAPPAIPAGRPHMASAFDSTCRVARFGENRNSRATPTTRDTVSLRRRRRRRTCIFLASVGGRIRCDMGMGRRRRAVTQPTLGLRRANSNQRRRRRISSAAWRRQTELYLPRVTTSP